MCNYDFEILQYNEFENLTRDLLQAEFDVFIESFKDGKDGGIDLRFGINKKNKCIVQVKRYKNWSSLKRQLEDEVVKVKKLDPQPKRYILSTSVALSPANKETIKALFAPYIKDTADILGRDDINNLLNKHPDIEKQYYKLWLASTEVMEGLLHKDVLNWSKFELDTIKEEIKKYVINESFSRALEILNNYGYVIISGIPGIGKTTLARMLVYRLLADEYEQFVYIEDNLQDGARLFQEGKKQVFFFDDFLGANAFEPEEKGFEGKLLSFINAIKREKKGKLFIMTTREYILTQAKEYYEKFRLNKVDLAKCTLDLGSYSKYIKANILYNHLAEANLPQDYIEKLLENKRYQTLIEHPYFNPRVIETYIDNGGWRDESADTFVPAFVRAFDNPLSVWESAFKKLPEAAKYALLVLGTMGREVWESDWHEAFKYFCRQNEAELHLRCTDAEWRENMRILEDCFIKMHCKEGKPMTIEQYNPAVLGFIVEYIRDNEDVQMLLITGARYAEQLFRIFTAKVSYAKRGDAYVLIPPELIQIAKERLIDIMGKPNFSCAINVNENGVYFDTTKLHVLYRYSTTYGWNEAIMRRLIQIDELKDSREQIRERLYFLEQLKEYETFNKFREVLNYMLREDKSPDDYLALTESLYSMGIDGLLEDEKYIEDIRKHLDSEIEDNLCSVEETQSLMAIVEKLGNILPEDLFPVDEYVESINFTEDQIIQDLADYAWERDYDYETKTDDSRLMEMMTSLRVQEEG